MPILAWVLINWRLIAILAVVVGGFGFFTWEKHKSYVRGREDALTKVEDANRAAKQKADQGSLFVETCSDAGGQWDRASGKCKMPR